MDESINNNIGIENTSVEMGSNAPVQSTDVFSVSVKSTLETAVMLFAKDVKSDKWKAEVFPRLWGMNAVSKPPLSENELKEMFDILLASKIDDENKNTDYKLEEIISTFKKSPRDGTFLLAKYIVDKYTIITIGEKEREMFIYKDGMYFPGAENLIIFPEIQNILGTFVTKNAKSETFHKIADMTSQPRSTFSATPLRYIPLKNGVYDFETQTLLPHSPSYKFTYQFPIIYDEHTTCPKTEAFFNQVLTPEQKVIMEEWIGFYFWRNYMFKKAMIFVGDGDTGKTTLLEVISNLLGKQNISSVSLQKMSSDKFSAAHLYEKHGNLVDELSARDISDTGAFKMATGNGTLTGEYKFGNQFAFNNFSKFTFACNRIPDVSDTNDMAYFNRWIVVRFENTITEKIPNFIDRLNTDEEKSGLFNLAMKGLKRLLDNQKFSYKNDGEETKNEMMRSGSSISMFASAMLEREDGSEISKEDMYDAYTEYCQKNNLSTQTKEMLGRKLCDYTTYISDGQILSERGKQVRGWRNVRIRRTEDKKVEEEFNNF
jgi:putative DNA primase/helicase